MAVSENSVRLNVTMSNELNEWLSKKSKELGVSKSSLISVAVGQYKAQVVMTDLVSKIPPSELQKLLTDFVK